VTAEVLAAPRTRRRRARDRGRWWRFALLVVITAVVLVPVAVPVSIAAQQTVRAGGLLPALARLLDDGLTLRWFGNSLAVAAATVLVSVAIGAPAGYVLSRARGRAVGVFALVVFTLQALPVILLVVPLYVVFVPLGLVDSVPGIAVVYVGLTAAVATWTMTTAIDAVPVRIEEAAWLDGCSVLGGFVRVVVPNAVPGLLATAVLAFLFAWNEYLVAVTFLISDTSWTVGVGVISGRVGLLGIAVLIPPVVVFAALHRFFRFGGLAGAISG
jgi:multiple sugar transport system permease protein